MEMEFFVKPGEDEEWHQYWIDERTRWYTDLGIRSENLRHYEHPQEKLSHYSKRTVDIEYRFGFTGSEWGELEGIANRTDFDLTTHTKHSGTDLVYFDQASGERYTPYVIEPAAGLSRSLMTFLVDAYTEDEAPNTKGGVDKRVVLGSTRAWRRSRPRCCRCRATPTSRPRRVTSRRTLRRHWNVDFDDAGAIGRRYRRQDEIGTPVLHHRRLRHARGPGRDDPRARHDGAGARRPRQGRELARRAPARRLTRGPAAQASGP